MVIKSSNCFYCITEPGDITHYGTYILHILKVKYKFNLLATGIPFPNV